MPWLFLFELLSIYGTKDFIMSGDGWMIASFPLISMILELWWALRRCSFTSFLSLSPLWTLMTTFIHFILTLFRSTWLLVQSCHQIHDLAYLRMNFRFWIIMLGLQWEHLFLNILNFLFDALGFIKDELVTGHFVDSLFSNGINYSRNRIFNVVNLLGVIIDPLSFQIILFRFNFPHGLVQHFQLPMKDVSNRWANFLGFLLDNSNKFRLKIRFNDSFGHRLNDNNDFLIKLIFLV